MTLYGVGADFQASQSFRNDCSYKYCDTCCILLIENKSSKWKLGSRSSCRNHAVQADGERSHSIINDYCYHFMKRQAL